MSLAAIVVTVLVAVVFSLWRRYAFFSSRGIPGPTPLPFLGNILHNRHETWMKTYKQDEEKYGKVYGIFSGTTPVLVVSDPVLLKKILVKDFPHFDSRPTDRFNHPIERLMLLAERGKNWIKWRKAMTPVFSPQKLRGMSLVMDTAIDRMLKRLEELLEDEAEIEVRKIMDEFTLEVIATAGHGMQMTDERKVKLAQATKQFYDYSTVSKLVLSFLLPTCIKRRINFTIFNREGLEGLCNVFREVVDEQMKDREDNNSTPGLISAYIDVNAEYEATIANILCVFLAGVETVPIMLSITIFLLAQHPEIQERLRREAEESTGSGVDFESVKDMKFMEAVFNESLRLFPPSTFSERRVSKDYDMEGVILLQGLNVFIPIYNMHHDESNFPDPETFDPDRFMPGSETPVKPMTFLPFGHGPRVCPGVRFAMLESKMMLSRLPLDYELTSCGSGHEKVDISATVDDILQTAELMVRFQRRGGQVNEKGKQMREQHFIRNRLLY